MMLRRHLIWLSALALLWGAWSSRSQAFVFSRIENDVLVDNATTGTPVIWQNRTITINLNFGSNPISLINGTTTWNQNAEAALNDWNAAGANFQWVAGTGTANACSSSDGVNSTGWSSTNCGDGWGDALASTFRRAQFNSSAGRWFYSDTDVVFNSTPRSWNAYHGPLRQAQGGGTLRDFRRVALHEFGHALGLDHPDQATPTPQSVSAIMNSTISNTDRLQADDINGILSLYGSIKADLTAASLSLGASSVSAGATVTVSYSVSNGGISATGTFSNQVRLSTNSTISTSDTLLTTDTISGGLAAGASTGTRSFPVTIPADTAVGSYFIGVIADSGGQVDEASETNNTRAASLTVTAPQPDIRFSTTNLNFGSCNVGSTCTSPISVFNDGAGELRVTGLAHSAGSDFGNVNITGDLVCPAPASGQTTRQCDFTITFRPTAAGTRNGTVTVTSNDPDEGTVVLNITGTGVGGGGGGGGSGPDIRFNTTNLQFGSCSVGQTCLSPISVFNDGAGVLRVSGLAPTGDFGNVNVSGDLLCQPGQQCDFTLTFTPSAQGARTGTITVTSDDPDEGSVVLNISGTGTPGAQPAIRFAATTLNFGSCPAFSTCRSPISVFNDGAGVLRVSGLSPTGDFGNVNVEGDLVCNPGQQCDFDLTFTPSAQGTRSGNITVTSNDPSQPSTVLNITGSGAAPALQLSSLSASSGAPGRLLTLTGSGFNFNGVPLARFSDGQGYSVEVPAVEGSSTSLTVAIPPYFNAGAGAFGAGTVSVQVVQQANQVLQGSNPVGGFQIQNLPSSVALPGTGLLSLLDGTLTIAREIDNDIQGTVFATSAVRTALADQIAGLAALVSDVEALRQNPARTFTLGTIDGNPITITESDLVAVDRMLKAVMLAQAASNPAALVAAVSSPGGVAALTGPICAGPEAQSVANLMDGIGTGTFRSPGQNYLRAQMNCAPTAFKTSFTVVAGSGGAAVGILALGGAPAIALAQAKAALTYLTITMGGGMVALGNALRNIGDPAGVQLVKDGVNIIENKIKSIVEGKVLPKTAGRVKSLVGNVHKVNGAFQATPPPPPPSPSSAFLAVGVDPAGGGSATGTGIGCPGDCTETYSAGANVTLTASPASGFYFKNWSGACSGAGSCNLTMDGDKGVTAVFKNTVTWSVSVSWSAPNLGASGSCSPSLTFPLNGGSASFDCGGASVTFSTTRSTMSVGGFGSVIGEDFTCSGSGGGSSGITETQTSFSGGGGISGSASCTVVGFGTIPSTVTGSFSAAAAK